MAGAQTRNPCRLDQCAPEASYLARLQLQTGGERAKVTRRALAPEEINPTGSYDVPNRCDRPE